jgi:hypothetical protein
MRMIDSFFVWRVSQHVIHFDGGNPEMLNLNK